MNGKKNVRHGSGDWARSIVSKKPTVKLCEVKSLLGGKKPIFSFSLGSQGCPGFDINLWIKCVKSIGNRGWKQGLSSSLHSLLCPFSLSVLTLLRRNWYWHYFCLIIIVYHLYSASARIGPHVLGDTEFKKKWWTWPQSVYNFKRLGTNSSWCKHAKHGREKLGNKIIGCKELLAIENSLSFFIFFITNHFPLPQNLPSISCFVLR